MVEGSITGILNGDSGENSEKLKDLRDGRRF